jgi:pilus assembly protein CpaF
MRPDRIVIGECRGGEALDMIQAMNTGHDGSLTTTHANTPRDAIARLETLVMMAGMDLPQLAIRQQIAGAVHLIVQINRLADGSRKCVAVTEIQGMEGNMVTLQDVFKYEQTGVNPEGKLIGVTRGLGIVPKAQAKFNANELNIPVEIYQSVLHHNNPEYP